jgi:hypothetical protein
MNRIKRLFTRTAKPPLFNQGDTIRLKHAKNCFLGGAQENERQVLIRSDYVLKFVQETEENYLFSAHYNGVSALKNGDIVYISKTSMINLEYKRL